MGQTILVVAAAILFEGKYLIARRGPGQVGEGLWEFPGGKVDPGGAHYSGEWAGPHIAYPSSTL